MIPGMKDSRSRWQPFIGTARIYWGRLTHDTWLQVAGSHQRRTSLLMPTTAFAHTEFVSAQLRPPWMMRPEGA
jgi:hypothetical protein